MGGAVDVDALSPIQDASSPTPSMRRRWRSRGRARMYTEAEAETFVDELCELASWLGITNSRCRTLTSIKLDNGFRVTATGSMETMFLPLGGFTRGGHAINEMAVNIMAEVVNSSNRVEACARHRQHRLDELRLPPCRRLVQSTIGARQPPTAASLHSRSGATTLVNTLMPARPTTRTQLKIGVVPFEGHVNCIGYTSAYRPRRAGSTGTIKRRPPGTATTSAKD